MLLHQVDRNKSKMRCKCGKVLKVGSQHAGRKLKCPKCGVAVEVPEAVAAGSARKRSGAPSGDGWRDSYKEFGAQDYTTKMMPQAKRRRKKQVQPDDNREKDDDGGKKVADLDEVNSSKKVVVSMLAFAAIVVTGLVAAITRMWLL